MSVDNVIPIGGGREVRPREVAPSGDMLKLAARWLRQLETAGFSDNTLSAYDVDLGQFIGYCAGQDVALVQHVTVATVQDFINALIEGNGISRRSAERKLRTVRAFMKYVCARGAIKRNPADQVARPKWVPEHVIAPEEGAILEMIECIPNERPEDVRDRALFSLMYSAGLRVGGVVCLCLFDELNPPAYFVHPTSGVVQYRAKGGRTEVSVCDETTLARIAEWLDVRHALGKSTSTNALFLSNRGGRVTASGVLARIKKHGARVGINHIHNHMLRHRRGGEVLERAGLRAAARLLGHTQDSTTANVYGHHAAERVRHSIRALAPIPWGKGDEHD